MRLLLALAALFGIGANASSAEAAPKHEEAVIVHFNYGHKDWSPLFEFETALEEAIAKAGAGEYDGNELAVDGSDGSMYMYGPDADKLFAVVKPHLLAASLLKNVVVTLRYGAAADPTARETRIELSR